ERKAGDSLEFVRKVRFGLLTHHVTTQLQLIRMLRGLTTALGSLSDPEFDEDRFEQYLESNSQLVVTASRYWIRILQAHVFANAGAAAVAAASKAASLLWNVPTMIELSDYHFYAALARAAYCNLGAAEERLEHMEALNAHHRQIAHWAKAGPATFANRAALV